MAAGDGFRTVLSTGSTDRSGAAEELVGDLTLDYPEVSSS